MFINIIEIYNKYHFPENLQMHMLRVAACSNLIIDNWEGKNLERELIIRVSLLHDMGNMVKIPEDFSQDEEFLKIRKKYFDKYGTNDHEINLEHDCASKFKNSRGGFETILARIREIY